MPRSVASGVEGRSTAAGGVSVEFHQQRVVRVAAGDVQRADGEALVLRVSRMAHAERNADGGAPVEAAERIEIAVEREPGDDAECVRVREGRAVTVEVGQDMETWGEVGLGGAQLVDTIDDALVAAVGSPPAPCQRIR